jgi:hypothetical protein rflaF_11155
MREAKFAASVVGIITVCLFGGAAVAYNAAPQVSTRDNFEIVEPASDRLTFSAETSVETTTVVTTAQKTTSKTSVTTTSENNFVYMADNRAAKANISYYTNVTTAAYEPNTVVTTTTTYAQPVTEAPAATAPSESITEAPTETTTEIYYEEPVYTEPETEAPTEYTEPYTEEETTTTAAPATEEPTQPPSQEVSGDATDISSLPISESDFILLCNVVGHEAGSYWIGEYEKAYVVEVVMNRVYSPLYPNSVYEVLTQPYQFAGSEAYVNLNGYSGYVTEAVKNAVKLYFSEPGSFTQGYFSFYGDGYRNYFR